MAKVAYYYLSIEPVEGKSYRLATTTGNDMQAAKIAAEQVFNAPGFVGKTPRSIAVIRGEGLSVRIADVFDGLQWDSDRMSAFDD